MAIDRFWVVADSNFPTKISYKHYDRGDAMNEAKRLANQEGRAFLVFELIDGYYVENTKRIEIRDEIPF